MTSILNLSSWKGVGLPFTNGEKSVWEKLWFGRVNYSFDFGYSKSEMPLRTSKWRC